jgi:hypothetical protein
MDRVVNDDIFVALATRPDLQSLEFQKAITAELVSFAKSRQYQNYGKRQLFPQLRKLVCTGEVDGLFSLLPHLTQLTHLETTLLGSHVSSVETSGSLLDIATYCPNLQFLNWNILLPRIYISLLTSLPNSPKDFSTWRIFIFQATMSEFPDLRLSTLPRLLRPTKRQTFDAGISMHIDGSRVGRDWEKLWEDVDGVHALGIL